MLHISSRLVANFYTPVDEMPRTLDKLIVGICASAKEEDASHKNEKAAQPETSTLQILSPNHGRDIIPIISFGQFFFINQA